MEYLMKSWAPESNGEGWVGKEAEEDKSRQREWCEVMETAGQLHPAFEATH